MPAERPQRIRGGYGVVSRDVCPSGNNAGSEIGGAGRMVIQTRGLRQRKPGKRSKSVSFECSSAWVSMARAVQGQAIDRHLCSISTCRIILSDYMITL